MNKEHADALRSFLYILWLLDIDNDDLLSIDSYYAGGEIKQYMVIRRPR